MKVYDPDLLMLAGILSALLILAATAVATAQIDAQRDIEIARLQTQTYQDCGCGL